MTYVRLRKSTMSAAALPLSGKVALVTGGASGIGAASVRALHAAGASVGIVYHASEAEALALVAELLARSATAGGARAVAVRADCGDDAAVRGAVAAVAAALGGRLDILVCSAGTTRFVDDLEALTDADWDACLRLNTRGPFYAARAAAPLMRAGGGGLVVFVGSVAAKTGAGSSIAYAASKGALATMTKSLAKALAPAVRVNAVAPGITRTRWLAGKEEFIDKYGSGTPMGRVAEAEDVAAAVLAFTAMPFVTGETLVVDGGREMRS